MLSGTKLYGIPYIERGKARYKFFQNVPVKSMRSNFVLRRANTIEISWPRYYEYRILLRPISSHSVYKIKYLKVPRYSRTLYKH